MDDEVDGQLPLFEFADDDAASVLALKRIELGEIRKTNKDKYDQLMRMGRKVDPGNVALVYLTALAEMLLDEPSRLQLDIDAETKMTDVLDAALSAVRRDWLGETGPGGGVLLR